MDPGRWHQIAHIYEAVLERTPEERGPFLAEASAGDEELRREVESLLAHDSAPVLIDRPMLGAAAAVLGGEEATVQVGKQFGPYRIDQFLGAGGMGQVYRATDTRLNRTVVIKILPPTLATDAQSRARFDREAKAIGVEALTSGRPSFSPTARCSSASGPCARQAVSTDSRRSRRAAGECA